METQAWRAATLGMYGAGASAVISFTSPLIVEQLGLDMLLPVTSITMLVNALVMLIFGYVLGLAHDLSGSYIVSFGFLAVALFLSEVIWLFLPAARAFDHRREESQKVQEKQQNQNNPQQQQQQGIQREGQHEQGQDQKTHENNKKQEKLPLLKRHELISKRIKYVALK